MATDPSGLLSNLKFATYQTPAETIQENTLSMTVDPTKVVPGTYPIYVTVTDASTGLTSVPTIVDLQVIQPTLYEETYNSDGVFEQDSSGNIIVSEGSDSASFNANADPDFPLVFPSASIAASKTALSARRTPAQLSNQGKFNPLNPPTPIADALHSWNLYNDATCWTVINASNAKNDPTMGGSANVGYYQVYAYCNTVSVVGFLGLDVTKTGYNLNTGAQSGQTKIAYAPYTQPATEIGRYGIYDVFTWPVISAIPTSQFAERQQVNFFVDYLIKGVPLPINTVGNETYYVNNKGVFYPKIQIPTNAAVTSVVNQDAGYVPFPGGPFYFCPNENPLGACLTESSRKGLRKNMFAAGLPVPAQGWYAHHIKPVSWCGSNSVNNGVFLPLDLHKQFTIWFDDSNFTPDASAQTGAACTLLSP